MKRNKILNFKNYNIYNFPLSVTEKSVEIQEDQIVVNWAGAAMVSAPATYEEIKNYSTYEINGGLTPSTSVGTIPGPFNAYYRRHRLAYLYPESYIQNFLQGKTIKEIGFECTGTVPTQYTPFPGYTVKIKSDNSTSITDITSLTGMTTIRSASNFTPQLGWNMFVLQTPFVFPVNSSSLTIEICWSQIPTGFISAGTHRQVIVSNSSLSRYQLSDDPGSSCNANFTTNYTSLPVLRVVVDT